MEANVYIGTLHSEQENLWADLANDLRVAINHYWSSGVENRIYRIVRVAKIVGPTPWEKVTIPLLTNGIYEAVLTHYDIPFEKWLDTEFHPDEIIRYQRPEWKAAVSKIKSMDKEY